jgi:hypothetical protein
MSGTAAARSGFVKASYANDSTTSGSATDKPRKDAAKDKNIGDRCDKTKHATLPADCKTTGPRDANAVNSTQGDSGAGAASAGSGAAGASGAAGSPGTAGGASGTAGGSAGAAGSAGAGASSGAGSSK